MIFADFIPKISRFFWILHTNYTYEFVYFAPFLLLQSRQIIGRRNDRKQ